MALQFINTAVRRGGDFFAAAGRFIEWTHGNRDFQRVLQANQRRRILAITKVRSGKAHSVIEEMIGFGEPRLVLAEMAEQRRLMRPSLYKAPSFFGRRLR